MMMMEERFSVSLNNFESKLKDAFQRLYKEKLYTDVTLVTMEGIEIRAHKIVLTSFSEFFRNILSEFPNKNVFIILPDITKEEIQFILNFIYNGVSSIVADKVGGILSAAKELMIDGLTDMPSAINILNGVENEEDIDLFRTDNIELSASPSEDNYSIETENIEVSISPSDMGGQMDEIDIDDGSDHLIIGESALSFIPEACLSNEENIQEVSFNEDLPREIKAQYITKIQEEVYVQDENGIKSKKKYHYEYEKLSCDYDECDYKADIYSLKKHKEAVHMGIKYSCDLCNYQTAWPGSLRSHRIKLHGQPQYECNECGYQGTSKSDLSAHINKRHQSNFKCGDCEYVAKQPGNLRKHIRSIHSGVKYPCEDCDYEATQRNSLKLHIEAVHKKIKYPCDLCHQTLSRKQLLKRHKLKMHSIS